MILDHDVYKIIIFQGQTLKSLKYGRQVTEYPKFAISSHFAIGCLPEMMTTLSFLLTPMRPFAYVMSYLVGTKIYNCSINFVNQKVEKI